MYRWVFNEVWRSRGRCICATLKRALTEHYHVYDMYGSRFLFERFSGRKEQLPGNIFPTCMSTTPFPLIVAEDTREKAYHSVRKKTVRITKE